MNILITGSSGFAAEHLIPSLKTLGHYIIGCDRLEKPSADVDEYLQFDLLNIEDVSVTEKNIDCVIHLAAARADWGVTDEEYFRDNFEATRKLLDFCIAKKINKFLFVSTIAVYPQENSTPLDEQAQEAPFNAYGKSKLEAENLLIGYLHRNPKFCLNIVRPSVLYGPSNPANTGLYRAIDNNVFRLIDGINKRRFLFIGDETTPKSTAYIKNFVGALNFLLPSKPGYGVYIYCDEPHMTTGRLVRFIRQQLGRKNLGPSLKFYYAVKIAKVSDWIAKLTGINFPVTSARIQTFNRPTAFKRTALNKLSFKQAYSSEEALVETIVWYKSLEKDLGWKSIIFKK